MAGDTETAKTCPQCGIPYDAAAVKAALKTCPGCGWHYRMEPEERIAFLADEGSFSEFCADIRSRNPVGFSGYDEKLAEAEAKTGKKEAVVTGTCTVDGRPLILGLMSFRFMGGSMGSVVGEKVSRALLKGAQEKTPVMIFTTSGGARMQEGIFSLMQMAKTASAVAEMEKARVPYFVMLCDPTTGGVTASYAMLGDVTLAEPGSLIGFAGPRVIEGTIRQTLPEGFQRAEFLLEKGFVDAIVPRSQQRRTIAALIDLHRSHP
ncbi:MAG: acetyl-CoA carboxylase, carboxyltransferase subunit beta [Treponema sp.]|nr:acetyl-CoA carboxylase, carboxyltransferase subunit beta [Treponema sp.]